MAYLSIDPWAGVLGAAEQETGLQSGLLSAIAQQENVNPEHNNPLGLSTDAGVMSFDPGQAAERIHRQARLITNPSGPYGEFARTGNIDALAQVWSPVGASNDINRTNSTEAAGIRAHMIGGGNSSRYLSTDPEAGVTKHYLSTDPQAGLSAKAPGRTESPMTPALAGASDELGTKPVEQTQPPIETLADRYGDSGPSIEEQRKMSADNPALTSLVTEAGKMIPQIPASLAGQAGMVGRVAGQYITKGSSGAVMQAAKEAVPMGVEIAHGAQAPVGSPEWARSMLQIAMFGAPAVGLLGETLGRGAVAAEMPKPTVPVEPPPVQPVPLDAAMVRQSMEPRAILSEPQGRTVEVGKPQEQQSAQAAAEADVLAGRTGQPVRGTPEAQRAAEQAVNRGGPAPALREETPQLPVNEEAGLPTAPGEEPDLANVGLDVGKKKNGINPTQVVEAIQDEGGTVTHNEVSSAGPEQTLIVKATGMTPEAWNNVAAKLKQDAIPVENPNGARGFAGPNEGGYKWDESQFQRPGAKPPTMPVESPGAAPATTSRPPVQTQQGGEPANAPGANPPIGVAAKYAAEEATPGTANEPGTGLEFGRKYVNEGGDPELPIRRAEKTGLVGPNEVGIVRAEYERRALLKRQAAMEAEARPNDPAAQKALAEAEKYQSEWRKRAQPVFTKWAEAGHEMQGVTDADMSTYAGAHDLIDQLFEGKKMLSQPERVKLRKAVDGVAAVKERAIKAAEPDGLIDRVVKAQKPKKLMSIDELREDLNGALKEQFKDCYI